jgi:hypothetical protein
VAANAVTAAHAGNIVLSMASGAQVMNTLKPFGTPLPAVGNIEMQRGTLEPGGLIVSGVLNGRVAVGPARRDPDTRHDRRKRQIHDRHDVLH